MELRKILLLASSLLVVSTVQAGEASDVSAAVRLAEVATATRIDLRKGKCEIDGSCEGNPGGQLMALGGKTPWTSPYAKFDSTEDDVADTVALTSDKSTFPSLNISEPGTVALFTLGLIGLLVSRRQFDTK